MKADYGEEFSVGLYVPTMEDYFILQNKNVYDLYFIEDLFSYSITGKLVFHDTEGIFEYGSFISGMLVEVIFGEDSERRFTSIVYKINRIAPDTSTSQGTQNVVELIFVDEHFPKMAFQRFSRSWKNTKISSIVSDIYRNMLDQPNISIEESNEKIDFTMPFWTPLQALNWLTERASSGSPKKWGYCGTSSVVGGFGGSKVQSSFSTLEGMLRKNRLLADPDEGVYSFVKEDLYNYNKILSYEISGNDIFSIKDLKGNYSTGHNFETKELMVNNQNYNEVSDRFTMLDQYTLNEVDRYNFKGKNEIHRTGESNTNIIENMYYNNWIKHYCMQNTFDLIVRGHETRKPGYLISIRWPSLSDDEIYNINYSGLYLIKAVVNHFSPKEKPPYRQKLVLIRNAHDYINLPEGYLRKANKVNPIAKQSGTFLSEQ